MGSKKKQQEKRSKRYPVNQPPHILEVTNIMAEETDRGAVLIATDFIYKKLEEFIYKKLQVNNPSQLLWIEDEGVIYPKPELHSAFEYPNFLTSGASQLKAAFIFGLVDEDFYYVVSKIKQIRNLFAHSIEKASLSKQDEEENTVGITPLQDAYDLIYEREFDIATYQTETGDIKYSTKSSRGKLIAIVAYCFDCLEADLNFSFEPKFQLNSMFYSS